MGSSTVIWGTARAFESVEVTCVCRSVWESLGQEGSGGVTQSLRSLGLLEIFLGTSGQVGPCADPFSGLNLITFRHIP
jgi:hypothetical protein